MSVTISLPNVYTDPSSSIDNQNRDLLLGCLAIIGRELVMREANAQIATLPPAVQEKSYRLMNRTVANLQDKVCGGWTRREGVVACFA